MMKKLTALALCLGSLGAFAQSLDFVHVLDQGYWYSRYNLGHLVMRSGNGETFMPRPGMVKAVVKMVSDDLSTATPPTNPALLKRVYNTGNPTFVNPANNNSMDFSTLRWSETPAKDEKTSYEAFAWTVTKEVEWSKQFNVDSHFGSPNGIPVPGAQERFAGIVLCVEASMQVMEFMNNPNAFEMKSTKGLSSAIIALSDYADYLKTPSTRNMKDNRCMKAVGMLTQMPGTSVSENVLNFASNLYNQLKTKTLTTVEEKAMAISAYTWFGKASAKDQSEVKALINTIGRDLARTRTNNSLELAYLVKALNDVARITGNPAFARAFESNVSRFLGTFDSNSELFQDKIRYTTDDVAVYIGALNVAKIFSNQEADVTPTFVSFFDKVLNRGNMQLSAPPINMIPAYERKPDSRLHRGDELPFPRMTGNGHGTAPVYSASVDFSSGTAVVETQKFDTAGSMRLANEMIWFHHTEVNGFPSF